MNILDNDNLLTQSSPSPTLELGGTIWKDATDTSSFAGFVSKLIADEKISASPYNIPFPYMSTSQISMFLSCPLKFENRYIKGYDSPPSAAMVQGSLLHSVIETLYNYKRSHREKYAEEGVPVEMGLDCYTTLAKKKFTKDVTRAEHETNEFLSLQGELLTKVFVKEKLPYVNPVAVEKSFVKVIAGVPVVGIIDLIDREDRKDPKESEFSPLDVVVDNKVVAKAWSQTDADNSLQMSIYAAATGMLTQRYDLFIKGNPDSILKAKSKAKGPRLGEITTYRMNGDIQWAGNLINKVAQSISSGIFYPCSPDSWACSQKWCGYWSECRGKYST